MMELNESELRSLFRSVILEQNDKCSILDLTKDMTDQQFQELIKIGKDLGLDYKDDSSVKEDLDWELYKYKLKFDGKTTEELYEMLQKSKFVIKICKIISLMTILCGVCGCEIGYFHGKHLPRTISNYIPRLVETSKVCEKDYKTGIDVCGYQIDIVFRKHLDKTHSYTVIHSNNMIDTDKHSTLENTYIKIYGLFPEVIEYCPLEQAEYWKKRNEQFEFKNEMDRDLRNDPDVRSRHHKPNAKEKIQLKNPDHKFVNAPCAKVGWSMSPVVDVTNKRVPDWKQFLKDKDGE